VASEILKKAHMIDTFPNGQKKGASYVKCLQEYVSHLSCSSTFKLSTGKMFEIMASGSALLTNVNDDLPLLFPPGSYFTYKTDGSDIIKVGRKVLDEPDLRNAVAKLGLEAIRTRHTHQVRIEELLAIIKSLKK
jgi:spore maturation protein CgeB